MNKIELGEIQKMTGTELKAYHGCRVEGTTDNGDTFTNGVLVAPKDRDTFFILHDNANADGGSPYDTSAASYPAHDFYDLKRRNFSWMIARSYDSEPLKELSDNVSSLTIFPKMKELEPEIKKITVVRKPREVTLTRDLKDASEDLEHDYTSIQYVKEDGTLIFESKIKAETVLPSYTNETLKSFQVEDIQAIEIAIRTATPTLLVGHTGLGKTTLVKEIAKEHGRNLVRFSVHSGITADEVIGKWLAIGGETVWQDGILTKAVRAGDTIVVDEINACPADVLFALHPLLDDDKHIILAEKDGEIVKAHPDFRFFATMNPQDDYAGTKELNMAFLSRFNAVITLQSFDTATEIGILERKGIKTSVAKELVDIANNLRTFQQEQDITWFCGTRDIISTGLLITEGLDKQTSYRIGLLNKMNTDDKQLVISKLGAVIKPIKSREQIERENLENENKRLTTALNNAESTVKIQQGEYEKLKISKGSGLDDLDEDTKKALKMLGVLKKTKTDDKIVEVVATTESNTDIPF